MNIAEHLCGVAIAYNEHGGKKNKIVFPKGRPQGSLINYQRRQLANACEWIRKNAEYQPRIFVCTTNINWGADIYTPNISSFTHNLRNGYGCKNYVWVREFNRHGAPHYHFIADMDRINDPVAMSLYWSGLFGYHTNNCVRLGTKPKNGRRDYILNSSKMAFYMSSYLGKDMRANIFKNSWHSAKMPGRKFGISQVAAKKSMPQKFTANYHFAEQNYQVMTASGKYVQAPSVCIGITHENEFGTVFNKQDYKWKKAKEHMVWIGRKINF